MPHCGNSSTMVASSVDTSMIVASGGNSMVPVTCNTGSLLPTVNGPSVGMHRGSLNSSDGLMSNGYQQALSNFSISSSGNNMVSSTVVQRMTSQMIPTPGFNSNNQSFMNLESSNDTGAFSTVESTMVSQPLQQKQHVGGQNSRILHNLGSHIGGGIRSGLQQKSYGYSNGTLNCGLGAVRNNLQFIDGPGSSEGYLATSSYGNSPKPLQKHYDQQQRPMMQGDGYGMSTPDSSGSGNFYAPVTSAGSAMNNQSLIPASVQSLSRATSPLMNNQSNLHSTQQVSLIKSQTIDPSAKMNFQASSLLRENLLQSRHQQQFQQQPLQLQQQQFVQNQLQQKQQIQQHQILFKNDSFGHSQVASDLGSQLKPEHGMECHDQALHSQVSEHLQFSELQNQFQHSSAEDHSRCTQLLSLPSIPENICSSLTQTSRQSQQLLHSHQLVVDSQNDFSCLSVGVRSERLLQGQWNPKSQDRSQIPGNFSHKQNIQEEFRQRITGQDEAQRNNLSTEGSICQTVVTTTAQPLTSVGATRRSANPNFRNQQRWLLFLRHARRCMAPEGKCQEVNCITVQKLWIHIDSCNVTQCLYPYCHQTKILLNHHKHCRDSGCPVCVPVKNFVQTQLKSRARSDCNSGLPCSIHGSCKSFDSGVIAARLTSKTSPPMVETFDVLQPSVKRVKTELHFQSLVPESENSSVSVPARGEPHLLVDAQHEDYQHGDIGMPMKLEVTKVKMEFTVSSGQGSPDISGMKKDNVDDTYRQKLVSEPIISDDPSGSAQQECIKNEKDIDQGKQENMTLHAENAAGGKSGKPKIKGVSLTELFTPEQIRQHIIGLRQWVGQVSLCMCLVDPNCPHKFTSFH
ncbi:histone acetyltransferase [Sarracenia purpurea var. burkii]